MKWWGVWWCLQAQRRPGPGRAVKSVVGVFLLLGRQKKIIPPRPLVCGLSHPNSSLLGFSAPLGPKFKPSSKRRAGALEHGLAPHRSPPGCFGSRPQSWTALPGRLAARSENPAGQGGAKTAHFLFVFTCQNAGFCSGRPMGRFRAPK